MVYRVTVEIPGRFVQQSHPLSEEKAHEIFDLIGDDFEGFTIKMIRVESDEKVVVRERAPIKTFRQEAEEWFRELQRVMSEERAKA